MTTGVACPQPILQFFLSNGQLNIGGYVAPTVGGIATAVYQDSGLTTPLPLGAIPNQTATGFPLNSLGQPANAAGASQQVFLTPNTVYTFTVYDSSGNQINQATYVGGVGGESVAALLATVTDQAILASYVRTAAEIAVAVTPTNYTYPPGDIRRYGGVDDNSTDNAVAINKAISVGGTIVFPAVNTGIYRTSGAHTLADGVSLVGTGMRTGQPFGGSGLKYTGAATMLTCVARNVIRDLELSTTLSAAPAGGATVGISIGTGAVAAGNCKIVRCRIINFHIGIQNGGALWGTVQDCAITNNDYGLAYNMSGSTTSNACQYIGNEIGFNGRGGVIGIAVPVRMNGQTFIGGSIEGNCQENTTTYPDQVNMGPVAFFDFHNVYFEYAAGGTPPNTINIQQAGQGAIESCFFNTGARHIWDSVGGSISQIRIFNNRFAATTTADITLSNETDVVSWGNFYSGVGVTLTGSGCRNLPTGSGLASWPNVTTSWTPTIKGASVAGTPTYTVQSATYSKTGNTVSFVVRVSISAVGGMSGSISIEGLPVACATLAGVSNIFPVDAQGITIGSSNTYFYAQLASNTTSLLVYQGGTTTPSQIAATQLAASTTIQISGTYQAAS